MKWLDDISIKSEMRKYLTYKYCAVLFLLLVFLFFVLPGAMVLYRDF